MDDEEILTDGQLALESVMLGLRTPAGIDLERLRLRFGVDLEAHNRARIDGWAARGLLRRDGDRLAPTLRGLVVAEALARSLEVTTEPVPPP